jgi:hypothetical protein
VLRIHKVYFEAGCYKNWGYDSMCAIAYYGDDVYDSRIYEDGGLVELLANVLDGEKLSAISGNLLNIEDRIRGIKNEE